MIGEIRKDDLVWISRWRHQHGGGVGVHFVVQDLIPYAVCVVCGEQAREPCAVAPEGWAVPLSWLKKVPPLSDEERRETLADLRVPAHLEPEEVG